MSDSETYGRNGQYEKRMAEHHITVKILRGYEEDEGSLEEAIPAIRDANIAEDLKERCIALAESELAIRYCQECSSRLRENDRTGEQYCPFCAR